jgi:hypothetical protein
MGIKSSTWRILGWIALASAGFLLWRLMGGDFLRRALLNPHAVPQTNQTWPPVGGRGRSSPGDVDMKFAQIVVLLIASNLCSWMARRPQAQTGGGKALEKQ